MKRTRTGKNRLKAQEIYGTYETEAKKEKIGDSIKCNEDTIIRIEIYGLILSKLNQGKGKEEIKNEILDIKKYKKYEHYLDAWIEDKMKPRKVQPYSGRFEKYNII